MGNHKLISAWHEIDLDVTANIQFQAFTEKQPDISIADRNKNEKTDRLFVRLLGEQLGGSDGVASILASTKQVKQNGFN